MLLLVALGVALIFIALKPFSDGLYDTSMWIAKIMVPEGADDNVATKQFVKMNQAALMDGWPSNFPFGSMLLMVLSVILGFIYHWWGGLLMFLICVVIGEIVKLIFMRPASYYLIILFHRLVNRAADYKKNSDYVRAETTEDLCKEVQKIMFIYKDASLKPPTPEKLKKIPYGDLYYWLNNNQTV